MQEFHMVAGTKKLLHIFIEDTKRSDGGGRDGLTYQTLGLSVTYIRPGDTSAVTLLLVDTTLGHWVSGGFKEIDAAAMEGWYELQLPNACTTLGFQHCMIHIYDTSGTLHIAVTNIRVLEQQRRLACRYPRSHE